MREILFRGKVERENEWVFGFYTESNPELDKGSVIENDDEYGCVVPETVGQYTGLKDKNGVKIFEGDIVRLYSGNASRIGEVKFGEIMVPSTTDLFESCEYVGYYIFVSDEETYSLLGYDGVEVIGNIYDNPELLEEK